jgi:hypothetical protein
VLIPPEVFEQFGSDDAIRAVLVAAVQLRDAVPPKRRRRTAA